MKYKINNPEKQLFDPRLTLTDNRILIIGDTHAPYQNAKLLHKAFSIAKKRKISTLLHAGDLIDGAEYNSQAKGENHYSIATELQHAQSILYAATEQFTKVVCIPGNHDHYYLKKEKITFNDFIIEHVMLGLNTAPIITTEMDYLYLRDFAVIGHPTQYEPIAGTLALKLASRYNRHALIAHDHLHGYLIDDNGRYGISIGGMFQPNMFWYKERSYSTYPESNLGFVIIIDNEIWMYDNDGKGTKI
jgi:predicted phosphodiesterase